MHRSRATSTGNGRGPPSSKMILRSSKISVWMPRDRNASMSIFSSTRTCESRMPTRALLTPVLLFFRCGDEGPWIAGHCLKVAPALGALHDFSGHHVLGEGD